MNNKFQDFLVMYSSCANTIKLYNTIKRHPYLQKERMEC